jgi:hypothetical protein
MPAMSLVLHLDGMMLLLMALCLTALGHLFQRWVYRIPVLLIALCDTLLGLNLLGVSALHGLPSWFWLRLVADAASGGLVIVWVLARLGFEHRLHIATPSGYARAADQRLYR